MIVNIEKFARDLRSEYSLLADRAVQRLRDVTLETAELVSKGKSPIRKLADTGIKLNRLSHESIEKLVQRQAAFVEGTLDDGARRLEMAARADSIKVLFGDQIARLPESRDFAVTNARETLEIVRGTGTEISDIVRGAIKDLSAKPAPKRATRKAAPKKTRGRKKTTRKVVRKAAKKVAKATIETPSNLPYEEWTRQQLYVRATELEIEGRSQMDKAELIAALRSEQGSSALESKAA